jgi:hypothetical protein
MLPNIYKFCFGFAEYAWSRAMQCHDPAICGIALDHDPALCGIARDHDPALCGIALDQMVKLWTHAVQYDLKEQCSSRKSVMRVYKKSGRM